MSAAVEVGTPTAVVEEIEIASIVRDTVVRAKGTNRVTVSEYLAAMLAGASFPPIVCYRDSRGVIRLADGAHRLEAAAKIEGTTTILAEIRSGNRKDCLTHAVGSAREFGLRFSTRDKRHQIELMLGNFPKWSDRKIAETLGVDHKTVAATKRRLAENTTEGGEIPQGLDDENPSTERGLPDDKFARIISKFRALLTGIAPENRATFADRVLAILSESHE